MIAITRLNHSQAILNSDLIQTIEITHELTPETIIRLTTGERLRVLESADEIVSRVRGFRSGAPATGRS